MLKTTRPVKKSGFDGIAIENTKTPRKNPSTSYTEVERQSRAEHVVVINVDDAKMNSDTSSRKKYLPHHKPLPHAAQKPPKTSLKSLVRLS